MRKILILFLIIILAFSITFGYFSEYLKVDEYSYEYSFLKYPNDFEIEQSVLFAYGITSSRDISYYISFINSFADEIENKFNKKNKIEYAKFIFRYIHENILKKYEKHAYRIDTLIDRGKYNCVSSTIFYNIILIKKGFNPQMVLTRNHTFTILEIGGKNIYIENTAESGFNYINNPHLKNRAEIINKLTEQKTVVLNRKEMILAIYSNRIYYIKDPYKAFQISLKALALDNRSIAKYENIKAGFLNYLNYLSLNKSKYDRNYNIIHELLQNITSYRFLIKRYKKEVNNYIIELVKSRNYEKALNILKESSKFIIDQGFLDYMNFYININYGNFYFNQNDYKRAYEKFIKAYRLKPNNKISKKNLNSTFIRWSQLNLKNKNYSKAKTIVNKGLEIFPESSPLKQMEKYLNKIDY